MRLTRRMSRISATEDKGTGLGSSSDLDAMLAHLNAATDSARAGGGRGREGKAAERGGLAGSDDDGGGTVAKMGRTRSGGTARIKRTQSADDLLAMQLETEFCNMKNAVETLMFHKIQQRRRVQGSFAWDCAQLCFYLCFLILFGMNSWKNPDTYQLYYVKSTIGLFCLSGCFETLCPPPQTRSCA